MPEVSIKKKTLKNRPRLFIALALFLFLVGGLLTYFLLIKKDESSVENLPEGVAFRIGDKSYTYSEVEDIIRYPVDKGGKSKADASKEAFDMLLNQEAATKLNINMSDEVIEPRQTEVKEAIMLSGSDPESYKTWVDLVARDNALKGLIGDKFGQGVAGYSYVFYFGQHQQYDPDFKVSGADDPKIIEEDRLKAKERADYYYNLAKSDIDKKVLLDRALKEEPREMIVYSKEFNSDLSGDWQSDVYYEPIVKDIMASKDKGLSDLKVGQAKNTSSNEMKDMYFYFYFLDSLSSSSVTEEEFNLARDSVSTIYRGIEE